MTRALFAAELRRLRRPMLLATALHVGALAALAYADELFVTTTARQLEAAAVAALAGLLFGIAQIGSWRRGGRWGFLLQRPLAPPAIFAALAGAATLVVAVAVALPLAVAGGLATLVAPADGAWRLLLAPRALGLVLTFWCAGAVVALRPWRGAALAVTPALLLVVPTDLGAWVLVEIAVVLLWLGGLALAALRPDLGSPPPARGALLAAAGPASYVLFQVTTFTLLLAYSLAVAFGEEGWRGPARFAWNDHYPLGTMERAGYLPARELLAWSLANASGDLAHLTHLADQLADAAVVDLGPEPGQALALRRASIATTAETDLLLADDALVQLPPGGLARPERLKSPLARLPLEGPPANLERVAVAVLADGLLVTVVEGRRSERGFAPARWSAWWLPEDRPAGRLATGSLAPGAPAWVRHRGFVISPLLQTADDLLRSTLWGVGPRTAGWSEIVSQPPPRSIVGLALALALLSAVATALVARRRGLAVDARRGWTIAALLLGPPVLLALPLFSDGRR
jgi:hypothetical protein